MSILSGLDLHYLPLVESALEQLAARGSTEADMAKGQGHRVEALLSDRLTGVAGKALAFKGPQSSVRLQPENLDFAEFGKRLNLPPADAVVWSPLFESPTPGKPPFAVRMLVEIRDSLAEAQRRDRAASKLEDRGETAAQTLEMRDAFEAELRQVAAKLIYSRVRIFTPKEGDTSFYICKTRNKIEAYKKNASETQALFRWFRTYIWGDDYPKICQHVNTLRRKWPQFAEVTDPEKFLEHALRIMDKDGEDCHLLSEEQMAIITDDRDAWAWGVVHAPEPKGGKFDAWLEWESKFACPAMVKWWRAWLAQIFDPRCASGLVTNRVRSAGNLGLVWIKSPGKEGSSVVTSLLSRLLGPNVTAAVRLGNDNFEMASYYGKRCVFADDIRAPRILYRGTFHSIVTGGEQSIEEKHARPFKGWVNCSVVCTSNSPIVANRYATDQMRRLVYIVLKPSKGPKDDGWGARLDEQFGDYMAECRKVLAELHSKYGTNDIFHHYEDPVIAEHYAATLRSDHLASIHDIVTETAAFGSQYTTRITALFALYAKAYRLVRGAKLDDADFEEIVIRDLTARFGVNPTGNIMKGIAPTVTAEQIRQQLLGEEEGETDE